MMQFLALSLYTIFLGFCFCDGFGLPWWKKLACFIPLLLISIYVLRIKDQFDLALILPVPTLLAFFLCADERRKQKKTSALS